jgi:hypothetical protein
MKYQADLSAESQIKPKTETPADKEAAQTDEQVGGWRQNYPGNPERWRSGYGLMPHAGMPCTMGMQLAKEAGLEIDELALKRGLEHHNKGRAEYADVIYWYHPLRRKGPKPIDPQREAAGGLSSMNGKLGAAAALYRLVDYSDSVEICARYCVYGYNNTRHGHGGMAFNNFWTPIGAWAAGEKGFKHFMKGQTWWRELYRRHDGAFNQVGRGGVGVAYALHYVAPKKRLRILGAPRSAFGTNCPDYLKPAVEAHRKRDYARCEELILREMDERAIPAEDAQVVDHILESVRILRKSVEHDLAYTERMIKEGKHYYASLELPQLKGVVSKDGPRLKAIAAELKSAEGAARTAAHRKTCEAEHRALLASKAASKPKAKAEQWVSLIAQAKKGEQKPADMWQMKVIENISLAPKGWTEPKFDDSSWNKASLPISWTMYHTALFRGKFNIEDKNAIDALRLQGRFFQQANALIYLNGKIIAKLDLLGNATHDIRLTDYALRLLRNGENTIAVSTRHKRRWGPYRGKYVTAATVDFWVDARKKD